jgi:hypothetical protein
MASAVPMNFQDPHVFPSSAKNTYYCKMHIVQSNVRISFNPATESKPLKSYLFQFLLQFIIYSWQSRVLRLQIAYFSMKLLESCQWPTHNEFSMLRIEEIAQSVTWKLTWQQSVWVPSTSSLFQSRHLIRCLVGLLFSECSAMVVEDLLVSTITQDFNYIFIHIGLLCQGKLLSLQANVVSSLIFQLSSKLWKGSVRLLWSKDQWIY